MIFSEFLNQLLSSASTSTQIALNGQIRRIKAMIHLTSVNYLNDHGDYYKILFTDGSFMLIMPGDEEVYFAPSLLGRIPTIADEDIGNKEILEYNGKYYKLGNKNDYQLVLKLICGSPLDIEGECRFSDYFPQSGSKEFLSLGWLVRTGERADINCALIDINNLKIIT